MTKPKFDVVTVTLNPAIDQTIQVPHFRAGEVNRVTQSQIDPGGKGVNVASFLVDYGLTVAVTGFLGSQNDGIFRDFFSRKGIVDQFVRITGQTRTGIKIIDPLTQQTTDINFPGETGTTADTETLFRVIEALATACNWFILSGSVPAAMPPSIYRELIGMLRQSGKQVVLDTSGPALHTALPAGPTLIKPNIAELEELVGESLATEPAILAAAQRLAEKHGIQCIVISMGKAGAIFVEGAAQVLAVPPPVEVKSTVGAGDAMVAGIVAGKINGASLAACARLSTAFAIDAISHVGSGLSSIASIEASMHNVLVRDLHQ